MKESTAIRRARELAKKRNDELYVVYEDGEFEIATADVLDTYFYGCRVFYTVEPDGTVLS